MMVNKRTNPPRAVEYTKTFLKSWERYNRAGRRNMNDVVTVMELIFANKKIPPEYMVHELKGDWNGARELHIGGDFLLIYSIEEKENLVIFTDLGTHSELFS
ncbi:type II toxin-antitoxin system YafQ family toxin [Salmonella enterica]|nr:type II toxin-antitoxin system YafQ family toxin [Salmonella enterica subsp. diarizonae]EJM3429743.1 type II toxin-antitoxin system YafQ family toxin [Salmonella enterica]